MTGWSVNDSHAYLRAKENVDSEALNTSVLNELKAWVHAEMVAGRLTGGADRTPRLLDVGAGRGRFGIRLVRELFAGDVHYIANDIDPELRTEIAFHARDTWLRDGTWERDSAGAIHVRSVAAPHRRADVLPGDLRDPDWLVPLQADLIVAHSMADLFDVRRFLDRIEGRLRPGGVLYAPVTVDGGTSFTPAWEDPAGERTIVEAYERSIDVRAGTDRDSAAGGRHAGRALAAEIHRRSGWELIAEGRSDWRVDTAAQHGRAFIGHILEFFEHTLREDPSVDPNRLRSWLNRRRARAEAGSLQFVVRNLDLLARWRG